MTAKPDIRGEQGVAPAQRLALYETMLMSREADVREDILFRQGRGQFHVSSSGHEPMAALAALLRPDDHIYCYYRDRALLLARGMSLRDMALGYFAKAQSCSGGRQMVSHFSDPALNIMAAATPTGLQCLPAAGTAWGLRRAGRNSVVFCCIGDASTRQGEFFEALAFAIQEKLPVVFLVEDNGYGISTPTHDMTPLSLNMLPSKHLHMVDGRDAARLQDAAAPVIEKARAGGGPAVLWISFDRLTSHTASDDQSKYRSGDDLVAMKSRDPLALARRALLDDDGVPESALADMEKRIYALVKNLYQDAEQAEEPDAASLTEDVFAPPHASPRRLDLGPVAAAQGSWTMAAAVNHALKAILRDNPNALMFGEDIEDPKGGVFGLTKGLSTLHPRRVVNSPLAEATIAGVAAGLPAAGVLPIFELQFVDFIGPAFNQIVNNIATLNWRSRGGFKCPLIIYAPCGSYIGGGGPWHSQTNESWLAHAPGLKVHMPANANDAAHLLYSAAQGEDPVIILLPKNQFQKAVPAETQLRLYPERARLRRSGQHVTLAAWGNCVELASDAAAALEKKGVDAEILDLCSIVPCDWQALHASVQKTGRLVVVQEDNRTCSFGQAILAEVCAKKATWDRLYAPPQLVSRDDVHIGFSRILERAALPDIGKVLDAVKATLGHGDG